MSRGGRAGKRAAAAVKAKGEDEDGYTPTLAPKVDVIPIKYPTLLNFPAPPPVDGRDYDFSEASRLIRDSFRYSGYYLCAHTRQSVLISRYSDRYRRRQGARKLTDEIIDPSPLIFTPEIYKSLQSKKPLPNGREANGALFMSAKAMEEHMQRLVSVKLEEQQALAAYAASSVQPQSLAGTNGNQSAPTLLEKLGDNDRDRDEDDEDRENGEDETQLDEDEDDMMGGDYTDLYQEDDDGEGGDVYGDDEGEVM